MYDNILVPTDGSEYADHATEHALSLAERFDATVHALRVVDIAMLAGPFNAGGVDTAFVDRVRKQARTDIERVENRWGVPDRFRGEVRDGTPSTTILSYVDEHDIDLVGMGTHGRTGLRRFVLGSVTEHVLRASSVPVLAARGDEGEPRALPYEDILVPTDGSRCAVGAVDHALAIADACGATIHAVTVVDTRPPRATPGGAVPSEYLERIKADGTEAVSDVTARAESAGVAVRSETLEGRPSERLLAYAEGKEIGLTVMGTHGRSGLQRFLLGSTTERLVRESSFPVMAVPSTDDGSDEQSE
jgi:nucleotide-binding universal stress UspA family protein